MTQQRLFRVVLLLLVATNLHGVAPNAAAPVRVQGRTVIVKSMQHATIVLVRNRDGDAPVEHLFQVWSNPGLSLQAIYHAADVEAGDASLVLSMPATKTAIAFTVKGHAATPVPQGFSTSSYEVFGLSHQTGVKGNRFRFDDPWDTGAFRATCTSGGEHATNCSQANASGSCSATCSAGGYACCIAGDPPACTCRAD